MDVWGGVDFGGTNIKLGLVTRQGRVITQTILSTRQHADPATFVRGVASALRSLAHANGARLQGVGIGAPGLIDPIQGEVTPLTSPVDGHFFARDLRRFAVAGMPIGKVAGRIALRQGSLLSA